MCSSSRPTSSWPNFYNRHLWNRMEKTLQNHALFESIDLPTIKALTTKLFKTRRGCARETLDVRRKLLGAMASRVSVLANDFDLPSLLGLLQCYTVHDMAPFLLEPLAIRATNHVRDYTPQECATLTHVLRKFRLMRFEVCERLILQISSADELNHHMVHAALLAVRTCWNKVSQGGRQALHAEPTKQKLRAMGEQVAARLGEAEFPSLQMILGILDIIVTIKIYVPKKALQGVFEQADAMLLVVVTPEHDMVDPKTGKKVRPVTVEEGRQLQALLQHYGADLSPALAERLRTAFREGLLPDEASL
ncbi:hypothetical protein STCU_03592 [Strigomonas culicis]|uniref:Mitochondrial RNA binding complex 1 subunit domain-containing protein n=1 Tax=Strigomonas culicis TaxID=28005 RepID=S9UK23_9TRYP|nr:hypothetical protein STCU_03592 [Strigomonas culicis]|eukprot:EPY31162.1 hypothetical protein STCU_03592 [Strigomonas culicis]